MAIFQTTSTWQRYKLGQNRFTTWLKETAEKVGGGSQAVDDAKTSKGKSSKQNPKAASQAHVVHWTELAPLAKTIVQNSEEKSIPYGFVKILKDVIAGRKKSYGFFSREGEGRRDEKIMKGNETHAHHIKVLENVLQIFEGAREKFSDDSKGRVREREEKEMSRLELEMTNLFGFLEVEDVAVAENQDEKSEEDVAKPEKKSRPKSKSGKKGGGKKKGNGKTTAKKGTPVDTDMSFDSSPGYEMEVGEDEFYFFVYCFFEDFNILREYLQERWCDYNDGLISLSAVAVVTNTAFDMFQRAEKEFWPMIPKDMGLKNFGDVANALFLGGLSHVDYEDYDDMDTEETSDALFVEYDWVALPVYNKLQDYLDNAPIGKVPLMYAMFKDDGPPKAPFYNDREGREEFTNRILMEFIGEIALVKPLKQYDGMRIPAEDELTSGLIEMLKTRRLPIWLVFASQVYVDIMYILETDSYKAHDELLANGKRLKDSVLSYLRFTTTVDPSGRNSSLLRTMLKEMEWSVEADFMAPSRDRVHKEHGFMHELEPYFLLRRHPLLCGLMVFRWNLTMNEHGLNFTGAWGNILSMTHFYNAIRCEIPTFPNWKDMDALIYMHGEKQIFAGKRPTNPSAYFSQREISRGVSAMEFLRQAGAPKKTSPIVPGRRSPWGLTDVTTTSMIFHDRYCFTNARPIITLTNVERLLNSKPPSIAHLQLEDVPIFLNTVADDADPGAVPVGKDSVLSAVVRESRGTHHLTDDMLLDALLKRISAEALPLYFDYFSMHIRCTLMLRAIHSEFQTEIERSNEGPILEDEGLLPIIVTFLFHDLMEEDGAVDGEGTAERLGRVMKPFIESEGDAEIRGVRAALGLKEKD